MFQCPDCKKELTTKQATLIFCCPICGSEKQAIETAPPDQKNSTIKQHLLAKYLHGGVFTDTTALCGNDVVLVEGLNCTTNPDHVNCNACLSTIGNTKNPRWRKFLKRAQYDPKTIGTWITDNKLTTGNN